jgi:hypothetical protein
MSPRARKSAVGFQVTANLHRCSSRIGMVLVADMAARGAWRPPVCTENSDSDVVVMQTCVYRKPHPY